MSVEVEMNFDKFQKEFEREISDLVWKSAKAFRDSITLLLTQTGKSNKKAPHNYSKAGQVPHNLSGLLGKSWKATKPAREGNKYTAGVQTPVVYAAALEFGYAPNNLKPRPYIKKSIEKAIPRIRKLINVKAMVARAAARSAV
jgi:hypothetical protein